MRTQRRKLLTLGAVLVVAAVAACSPSGAASGLPGVTAIGAVAPAAAGLNPTSSWPTYARTGDRTGYYPGLPTPRTLSAYWAPPTTGQIYAQPLVVGGLVILTTERNYVYAIVPATKKLAWRVYLGAAEPSAALPCGNISPYSGITGTPAYDPSTGSLYVVAETTGAVHTVYAINALTGRILWHRPTDLPWRARLAQQQRGALAVAKGRVYVPFGGRYGDCGNYGGYVTSFPTNGLGPAVTYQVPTTTEGGIWAPPGPSVATDGSLFVSVGNGASQNPAHWDGSDAVLHLSAALRRLSYFRPTNWVHENAYDLDLGSSGPMILPGNRVLISGKAADTYLLNTLNMGAVSHLHGCAAYGGDAYDPVLHAAFLPCESGLERINVGATSLTAAWHAPETGSPTIAGGLVWYQSYGTLIARNESNMALRFSRNLGATSRFATPVVVRGYVIVGTMAGVSIFRTG